MSDKQYVLGYWDIRGIGSPIRIAFALAGKPLVDKMYTGNMENGKFVHNWGSEYDAIQKSGQHPFPNLPYLKKPDGKMLVQSEAILRHVAREFGLYGDDKDTMDRVDELLEQINDLRMEAVKNYYSEVTEGFLKESLPYFFSTFEEYRKLHPTKFLCADKPLIVDCLAYEIFRTTMTHLSDEEKKKYPRLMEFMKNFEAIPQLQEYFKSDKNALPANNKRAVYNPK